MAFPTTSTLDDFNRGSIGSGWTADPLGLSHAILEIVSNSINGGAGAVHTAAYWNATTYGADTEAGCLCPVWDTGGNFHGVSIFVRLAQVGSSSTVDGYRYNFRNDTADVNNDLVELYRRLRRGRSDRHHVEGVPQARRHLDGDRHPHRLLPDQRGRVHRPAHHGRMVDRHLRRLLRRHDRRGCRAERHERRRDRPPHHASRLPLAIARGVSNGDFGRQRQPWHRY
jgi:hypothetical protein